MALSLLIFSQARRRGAKKGPPRESPPGGFSGERPLPLGVRTPPKGICYVGGKVLPRISWGGSPFRVSYMGDEPTPPVPSPLRRRGSGSPITPSEKGEWGGMDFYEILCYFFMKIVSGPLVYLCFAVTGLTHDTYLCNRLLLPDSVVLY